jgi:hypothetical protein
MGRKRKALLIAFLIMLILEGCFRVTPKNLSEIIPDGSIVFLPDPDMEKKIGYFTIETLKPRYLKTPENMVKLNWQPESKVFVGLSWYRFLIAARSPLIWGTKINELIKSISQESLTEFYSIYRFTDNEKQVFNAKNKRLWLFDLTTEKVLLTLPDPICNLEFEYGEISFDHHSNCLFAQVNSNILRLSPDDSIQSYCFSSDRWELVTTGRNPQVSPDGSQLAFTKDDGLYIMDLQHKTERQVLSHDLSNQDLFSPHPEWSSDGTKMVLHVWTKSQKIPGYENATIFLIDLVNNTSLDTGINGIYPSFKD